MSTCRDCPHDRLRHTHHRAGSDCGTCACRRFRKRRAWHAAPVDTQASVRRLHLVGSEPDLVEQISA